MHASAPEWGLLSPLRGWLEVVAIIVLIEVGGIVGSLTGFLPAVPIGSIALPLLAATVFMRREGTRWRELAFPVHHSALAILAYAALALAAAISMTMLVSPVLEPLGLVYQHSRNLLPLFLAHGLIDTFSMTAIYLGHAELLTF